MDEKKYQTLVAMFNTMDIIEFMDNIYKCPSNIRFTFFSRLHSDKIQSKRNKETRIVTDRGILSKPSNYLLNVDALPNAYYFKKVYNLSRHRGMSDKQHEDLCMQLNSETAFQYAGVEYASVSHFNRTVRQGGVRGVPKGREIRTRVLIGASGSVAEIEIPLSAPVAVDYNLFVSEYISPLEVDGVVYKSAFDLFGKNGLSEAGHLIDSRHINNNLLESLTLEQIIRLVSTLNNRVSFVVRTVTAYGVDYVSITDFLAKHPDMLKYGITTDFIYTKLNDGHTPEWILENYKSHATLKRGRGVTIKGVSYPSIKTALLANNLSKSLYTEVRNNFKEKCPYDTELITANIIDCTLSYFSLLGIKPSVSTHKRILTISSDGYYTSDVEEASDLLGVYPYVRVSILKSWYNSSSSVNTFTNPLVSKRELLGLSSLNVKNGFEKHLYFDAIKSRIVYIQDGLDYDKSRFKKFFDVDLTESMSQAINRDLDSLFAVNIVHTDFVEMYMERHSMEFTTDILEKAKQDYTVLRLSLNKHRLLNCMSLGTRKSIQRKYGVKLVKMSESEIAKYVNMYELANNPTIGSKRVSSRGRDFSINGVQVHQLRSVFKAVGLKIPSNLYNHTITVIKSAHEQFSDKSIDVLKYTIFSYIDTFYTPLLKAGIPEFSSKLFMVMPDGVLCKWKGEFLTELGLVHASKAGKALMDFIDKMYTESVGYKDASGLWVTKADFIAKFIIQHHDIAYLYVDNGVLKIGTRGQKESSVNEVTLSEVKRMLDAGNESLKRDLFGTKIPTESIESAIYKIIRDA